MEADPFKGVEATRTTKQQMKSEVRRLIDDRVEDGLFLDAAEVKGNVLVGLIGNLNGVRQFPKDGTPWAKFAWFNREEKLFHATTVRGPVSLIKATVRGDVFLHHSVGDVSLIEAKVKGEVSLGDTYDERYAERTSFDTLSLVRGEFTQRVSIYGTAKCIDLSGARFVGGLTARVGEAEVKMGRVEVLGLAMLANPSTGSVWPGSSPRLLQLAGTDVASLTLTGVDLTACRFSGTINLDKLHIDGSPQLAVRRGLRAHRRVLSEELAWRLVTRRI